MPTADRSKATVLVKIRFKSYDHRVLPEMSAKITFLAPGTVVTESSNRPVLTVPAAAVVARNGRAVVFQMKDDRAVEVPVVTGQTLGNQVEIKQGLKDGDKVVLGSVSGSSSSSSSSSGSGNNRNQGGGGGIIVPGAGGPPGG